MKKIILSQALVIISAVTVFSQSNNPFNEKGAKISSAVITLTTDFKAGKLTEINYKIIAKYKADFAVKGDVSDASISSLYTTATGADFNYVNTINNSSASDYIKSQTIAIIDIIKITDATKRIKGILAKVDEIKTSDKTEVEKEALLTTCAGVYNLSNSTNSILSNQANRNLQGAAWGSAIGIAIGAAIGTSFCGPVCGFAGAVIFGFVGNIAGGLS